jgi:hypothetical protein
MLRYQEEVANNAATRELPQQEWYDRIDKDGDEPESIQNRKTTGETNNNQEVGDGNESCNRKPTRRTEVPQEASSERMQE